MVSNFVSADKALERRTDPDLKLYVRDVRDRQGRKRPITVRSWSAIKDVKDILQQIIHVPPNAQRLYFGPLLTSGKELPNHRSLADVGIYRSGETLLLDINVGSTSSSSMFSMSMDSLSQENTSDICISSSVIDSTPRLLKQLVQNARRGFALGLKPEFVLDGSGGTYFLHDARKVKIGVFKPADEEPYAENNPRGYVKQTGEDLYLREGVVPGEACIREVAAYMLDHSGFSGVPMTTLCEARHPHFNSNGARLKVAEGGASIGAHSINPSTGSSSPPEKVGSFQEFVRAECTMDDLSPSKISVDEVHKIAILDIRLLNADRNSANLLCRRRRDATIELVPIDHGFCLRSVCDVSWMDWCWLDWPQLKEPMSKKTKKYILGLDIEADARLLSEQLNISTKALDYFRASSSILKAGVQAGLSLYDIAIMCCRNDNLGEIPSKLEVLFSMASELALSAVENGRWHHAAASRALAEQLSPKGGSLLSPPQLLDSSSFRRSSSAIEFGNFVNDSSKAHKFSKREVPGMIQSSASDSSSDAGDGDREDCDDWAAALIADVSMDKSMPLLTAKERSSSIESDNSNDSCLSSSPSGLGFWHTRPGSPSTASDEDSISWGLTTSRDEQLDASHDLPSAFDGMGSPIKFSGVSMIMNDFEDRPKRQTSRVSFSEPPREETRPSHQFHRSSIDFTSFTRQDTINSVESSSPEPPFKRSDSGGMTRSVSYSALTAMDAKKEKSTKMPQPCSEEHDQYRDYFLKFVDLVIARETTAASRHINH